jgi:hypothetical protein
MEREDLLPDDAEMIDLGEVSELTEGGPGNVNEIPVLSQFDN